MPTQDTRPQPAGKGGRMEIATHGRVRLEISVEHLSRLLASRQLCAADFHCLDGESRCCVQTLCQKNCSRYLAGQQRVQDHEEILYSRLHELEAP